MNRTIEVLRYEGSHRGLFLYTNESDQWEIFNGARLVARVPTYQDAINLIESRINLSGMG